MTTALSPAPTAQHAAQPSATILLALSLFLVVIGCGQIVQLMTEFGLPMLKPGFDPQLTEDFLAYHQGATASLHGDFPYEARSTRELFGFVYPPPSILLFLPFGLLPLNAGWYVWQLLNMVIFGVTIFYFARTLGYAPRERVLVTLFALTCQPTFSSFFHAQVNTLLTAAIIDLLVWQASRPRLAGIMLASAAAVKIFPALLGILFLRSRGCRAVLWWCIGLGVASTVFASVLIGFDILPRYIFEFLPATSKLSLGIVTNQSLMAFLMRMTVPHLHWLVWDSMQFSLPGYVMALNYLAFLILGIFAAYRCWRNQSHTMRMVMGMMLLAAVPLVTPRGWSHCFVMVLPLLFYNFKHGQTKVARGAAVVAAMAFLIPINPEQIVDISRMTWLPAFFVGNCYFLATVALIGVTLTSRITGMLPGSIADYIPDTKRGVPR
jgi:Glycosyltransferase family 87